jgi:hypothetical protein
MRVRAVARGEYGGIFRDVGDVFDIPDDLVLVPGWRADSDPPPSADSDAGAFQEYAADASGEDHYEVSPGGTDGSSHFSDASQSMVPDTDPAYPVFGWMQQVPDDTPLYSYALSNGGAASPTVGEYGTNAAGVKHLAIRRYVV